MKPQLMEFKRFGEVLTQDEAGEAAGWLHAKWDPRRDLVLSFQGVAVATPSFLERVVVPLYGFLKRNEESIVAFADLGEEVHHSLELLADRHRLLLTVLGDDPQIELLGGPAQLHKTFDAAQELGGEFQVRELAKRLKIEPTNLHQRLNSLMEAGAVTREPDESAQRGRRFRYKVADPSRLAPLKNLERI